MDDRTKARIYRMFYVHHLPPSEIDELMELRRGTAKAAIKKSWLEDPSYVAILIGVDHGSDYEGYAGQAIG